MDDTFSPLSPLAAIEDAGTSATGPTQMIPALPLIRTRPGAWNPRKVYDPAKTAALAEDIKARGILEPLVVRAMPDGDFEIVCGERRWRAAQIAGLLTVPAVVRVLDDREALECAVSENGQREPLHPLEEADAYATLHMTYGESPEDIAERFGVKVSQVHQRLSLARLCDEGRDSFRGGELTPGTAARIARLPAEHQAAAVAWVAERRAALQAIGAEAVISPREVGTWIRSQYHLKLAWAPFDTTDAALLAGVGACGTCPRNTVTQGNLFDDEPAEAECTDPVCYGRKTEVAWQAIAAAYLSAQGREGATVLSAQASALAAPLNAHGAPGGGYVVANVNPYEYGLGKKTWRQLLGVHCPETVIARGHDRAPVELFEPAAHRKALVAAGLKKPTKAKSAAKSAAAVATFEEEESTKSRIRDALREAAAAPVGKLRGLGFDDRKLWQCIAGTFIAMCGSYAFTVDFAKRFPGKDWRKAVLEEVSHLSASGCRNLLLDAIVDAAVRDEVIDADVAWGYFGVDQKAVTAATLDAIKAEKAPAAKPAAKKAPAKPAKKAPAKPAAKKGGRK